MRTRVTHLLYSTGALSWFTVSKATVKSPLGPLVHGTSCRHCHVTIATLSPVISHVEQSSTSVNH